MGHCLVQQGLFGIEGAAIIGDDDNYLISGPVIESFGIMCLSFPVCNSHWFIHNLHVVQMQFPGQFLYSCCHVSAFAFGKGASLVGRSGGLAKEFGNRVVGS